MHKKGLTQPENRPNSNFRRVVACTLQESAEKKPGFDASSSLFRPGSTQSQTLEGTLALIKPDAVHHATAILKRIADEGFLVVEKQRMNISRAKAARFYGKGRHTEEMVDYLSSGEVVALCLAAPDGINRWRRVLGPTRPSEARLMAPNSIRAIYGDPDNDFHNAAHGST